MIFHNFNFELQKNDFCFVIGKSGIGKTSLVKFLIRQLLPPKKMIFFKKEDIARFTDAEVQLYRRKIGVVFQDYKLIGHHTVRQNVIYPLEMLWQVITHDHPLVTDILVRLNLFEKKDFLADHMSGGEKQRIAIARALATQPEFIIADEPTGNLDWELSREIADAMIDVHRAGHTIMFITHDQRLIEYVNQKITPKVFELH